MGCGSFTVEQCRQVRDTADTIGIRQQAVVQVVEVQDGELMDRALPATRQKRGGQEKAVYEMRPAAKDQF
jgi:hypothetical protein